jgi:imidazole glycerol-phosphate synthase subunit HisH
LAEDLRLAPSVSICELRENMIAIVDYGLGNLESVKYALDRLGQPSALTRDAGEILSAEGVILPGVGAFGQAMQNLRELKLVDPMRQAAASGRPVMGICLGAQLLLSQSEEHGVFEGLDIIKGQVKRFAASLTVPHMGWNQIRQVRPSPLFADVHDESFFYFAHSYYLAPVDPSVTAGATEYGGLYASLLQQGNVFGAQFHPEKSGPVGLKMLTNFCALCRK